VPKKVILKPWNCYPECPIIVSINGWAVKLDGDPSGVSAAPDLVFLRVAGNFPLMESLTKLTVSV
jgi:hypothetical protein